MESKRTSLAVGEKAHIDKMLDGLVSKIVVYSVLCAIGVVLVPAIVGVKSEQPMGTWFLIASLLSVAIMSTYALMEIKVKVLEAKDSMYEKLPTLSDLASYQRIVYLNVFVMSIHGVLIIRKEADSACLWVVYAAVVLCSVIGEIIGHKRAFKPVEHAIAN
jgi:hypothetical protein